MLFLTGGQKSRLCSKQDASLKLFTRMQQKARRKPSKTNYHFAQASLNVTASHNCAGLVCWGPQQSDQLLSASARFARLRMLLMPVLVPEQHLLSQYQDKTF